MFNLKTVTQGIAALALMAASAVAFAAPVNVNTADAVSLAANINGVGAKKAEAIIEYREANGPFKSVEDLQRVKGIGPKTIENNREVILLSDNVEQAEKVTKK